MKNIKSTAANFILLLLSVLGLVFFSQSFYKGAVVGYSGYDILNLDMNILTEGFELTKVSVLICVIALSLMILVTAINLLISFKVIKAKKLTKVLDFCNILLSLIVLAFSICAFCNVSQVVSDENAIKDIASCGWALIANLVIAIISVVASISAILAYRKKK